MSGRLGARVAAAAVTLLFAAMAFGQLDPLHVRRRSLMLRSQPLDLPPSDVLAILSLGHRSSVADLLYLWSIQFFSGSRSQRHRDFLVRLQDTITDLDPHFRDAYWLGFITLLDEARDPAAAFALVDKALLNEPDYALIAIEAAMAARMMRDQRRVERYLRIAAEQAGDPLAQRLLRRVQVLATAQEELAEWSALLDSQDELTRAVARQHVHDLRRLIDVERLTALVACHERETGAPPASLEHLVRAGYLREIPLDPDGQPYVYDARSRRVSPREPYRSRQPSRALHGVDLGDLGRCAPSGSAAAGDAP